MTFKKESKRCYKCNTKLKHYAGVGDFCPNTKCDAIDNVNGFDDSFVSRFKNKGEELVRLIKQAFNIAVTVVLSFLFIVGILAFCYCLFVIYIEIISQFFRIV